LFKKQFAREVDRIYGPHSFFKSGKGLRKKQKKTICSSPHAGFNCVFRISKFLVVLDLLGLEDNEILGTKVLSKFSKNCI
jgi:hypothetical protein